MTNDNFSRDQSLAAVQALIAALNQDVEGRVLLPRFINDPEGVVNEVVEWLQAHSATMPPQIATSISGGQVGKVVNILKAGIVLIQHASPSSPTHDSSIWNIPYLRNPFFTGRETVLQHLHEAFTSTEITPISPQALSGLAGIGKTQIALEYAYRYRNEYNAVLWIRADSPKLLASDFAGLASLLDLPEKKEPEQNRIIDAVRVWLNTHPGWLLIFDDVEDLIALKDFLPSASKGHILLTTRTSSGRRITRRLHIDKMQIEEGMHFLLRRSNSIPLDASLESASERDRTVSQKIIEILDGHALALDQAGAYIEENPCSLSDYLHLYETRRAELLKQRGEDSLDHPESVTTTWSLSFKKIARTNHAAAELLKFLAFLHPDAIPEELLVEGASHLGSILKPVVADQYKLNAAIKELLKYSLISRNSEVKTLSIHRLVQAVLKDQMSEETKRRWVIRTVQAVNAIYQDPEFTRWERYWLYLPHAYACAALIQQYEMISTDAVQLLGRAGSYLQGSLRYIEAEPFVKQALETLFEHTPNPEPLDVAFELNNLALLYREQGKYAEAEPLVQRALAIYGKVLGSEHPETVTILNNLALLYRDQGKYAEAEPLFQRALAIREKILGPEHPETATSLNNLARLYREQGRYAEAESLYQRALAIREKVLGPEHPDVATSLNNLVSLYQAQGKYDQVEILYKKELNVRETVLGLNHLEVVKILNDLAYFYYNQGLYEKAEPLYRRTLDICQQTFGDEHPSVASFMNNLAATYDAEEKYTEAEPLYKAALSIREKVLGPEHQDVAEVLDNYAGLLHQTKRKKEAAKLESRAQEIRAKYDKEQTTDE